MYGTYRKQWNFLSVLFPVICIYPESKNSKQATLHRINKDKVATKKSAARYINGCWPCHHRSTCYEAGRSAWSLHKSLKFECLQIGAISPYLPMGRVDIREILLSFHIICWKPILDMPKRQNSFLKPKATRQTFFLFFFLGANKAPIISISLKMKTIIIK